MKNNVLKLLKNLLAFNLLVAALIAISITIAKAENAPTTASPSREGTVYSVKPDYRKCAFPMCGGWHLTPVNQYSILPQTEDEAYDSLALLPNSIYVSYLNFKALGLSKKQVEELQGLIHTQQVLLRGTVTNKKSVTSKKTIAINTFTINTLNANGAWVSANNNPAVGPYQRITSTGIVCITIPCPYFKTQFLNSNYSSQIDALNFDKVDLTREQQTLAWQAISTTGLIITGTTYTFTGFDETGAEPGIGIGIKASQVFFSYPAKQ